jgi:hypothetical protein
MKKMNEFTEHLRPKIRVAYYRLWDFSYAKIGYNKYVCYMNILENRDLFTPIGQIESQVYSNE